MFAFFSLGMQEIVVLLLVGLLMVAGPIITAVVVLSLARRPGPAGGPDAMAELRAEVGRLREDVDRLKKGSG